MGEFASTVQTTLKQMLACEYPTRDWQTEYNSNGTPVDVAGLGENTVVLVELEWRRADPANNTAKLFRHLDEGSINHQRVSVFQLFTRYYDLARGGHSSKRENAEFVGYTSTRAFDRVSYSPIDLDIDPPKRGGDWPTDWKDMVSLSVERLTHHKE
ncbi:hypothetical protein ACFQJ7_08135 [Halovenus rubra]|uniref:Uncharacterized protein n=2 Tax=Halovenus rubra TaxID=869890 RepID=A0ACC7E5C4_9EURY|nr:hypothetical protein [Halovenus rubra]